MSEGLRERKKRLMRQQLSQAATAMFLERGFDAVRVAEVAQACGVSEKTVFNYFPVKEALVMDRLETTLTALRAGLADQSNPPVQAVLVILERELDALTRQLDGQPDAGQGRAAVRRFGDLIRATPSLRAYQADLTDQAAAAAAEVLAARSGMTPADPEPQIAARALLGLWRVQGDSLRRHLDDAADSGQLRELVTADVRRAARLIETGLQAFAAPVVPAGLQLLLEQAEYAPRGSRHPAYRQDQDPAGDRPAAVDGGRAGLRRRRQRATCPVSPRGVLLWVFVLLLPLTVADRGWPARPPTAPITQPAELRPDQVPVSPEYSAQPAGRTLDKRIAQPACQ